MLQYLEVNAGRLSADREKTLQPTLLGGSSSSLASLTLTNGYYALGSLPAMPGLRHLQIRQLGPGQEASYLKLHEFFSHSQHLVSLYLVVGSQFKMKYTIAGSTALLPSLSVLRLKSRSEVVCTILNVLPDTLQKLSVIMDRQYASDQQERLIKRVWMFLRNIVTNDQAKFKYQVRFSCGMYQMFFGVVPIWLSSGGQTHSSPVLSATCQHRITLSVILTQVG